MCLGIIEPVPQGKLTEWCRRMVIAAKKDVSPCRAADMRKLKKATLRVTHHTPSLQVGGEIFEKDSHWSYFWSYFYFRVPLLFPGPTLIFESFFVSYYNFVIYFLFHVPILFLDPLFVTGSHFYFGVLLQFFSKSNFSLRPGLKVAWLLSQYLRYRCL